MREALQIERAEIDRKTYELTQLEYSLEEKQRSVDDKQTQTNANSEEIQFQREDLEMRENALLREQQKLRADLEKLEMDGKNMELAITDEFDFEDKHYVLCAEVEGDMLNEEEGLYLFRAVSEGDDITVETIESEEEYNRIVDAYYEMCEEDEA